MNRGLVRGVGDTTHVNTDGKDGANSGVNIANDYGDPKTTGNSILCHNPGSIPDGLRKGSDPLSPT